MKIEKVNKESMVKWVSLTHFLGRNADHTMISLLGLLRENIFIQDRVVVWVWTHKRVVRFGHLLMTFTMQGGEKGM